EPARRDDDGNDVEGAHHHRRRRYDVDGGDEDEQEHDDRAEHTTRCRLECGAETPHEARDERPCAWPPAPAFDRIRQSVAYCCDVARSRGGAFFTCVSNQPIISASACSTDSRAR